MFHSRGSSGVTCARRYQQDPQLYTLMYSILPSVHSNTAFSSFDYPKKHGRLWTGVRNITVIFCVLFNN